MTNKEKFFEQFKELKREELLAKIEIIDNAEVDSFLLEFGDCRQCVHFYHTNPSYSCQSDPEATCNGGRTLWGEMENAE